MKYKYIDTHCHLNIEPYINNVEKYINNLKDQLVNVVGTTLEDSIIANQLSKQYDFIFCTIGIHPNEVENYKLSDVNKLEKIYLNNKNKIYAIGETGLDYHYENYNKKKQLLFLDAHFMLAKKYNLTLVLHVRDAHYDMINYLKSKIDLPKIIIHCFTGNKEDLEEYLKLGCYISISGIITFKNAIELKNLIPLIPLDKLLTETDAPFLTPVPYRSKLNLPQYVLYVNECISQLLSIKINELEKKLMNNAKQAFNF